MGSCRIAVKCRHPTQEPVEQDKVFVVEYWQIHDSLSQAWWCPPTDTFIMTHTHTHTFMNYKPRSLLCFKTDWQCSLIHRVSKVHSSLNTKYTGFWTFDHVEGKEEKKKSKRLSINSSHGGFTYSSHKPFVLPEEWFCRSSKRRWSNYNAADYSAAC